MPKGLCVINMKGGVGKTTLAVNLAWAATLEGYKTLVVDLDPQFNASVYLMRELPYLNYLQAGGLTVFDIFEEFTPARDPQRPKPTGLTAIYTNVNRPWNAKAALHLIPAQLELAWTLKNPAQKTHLLANFLQREASSYDLVIVDPPPTDSMATEAAYMATNYVLVPVKPEFLSTIGFPLLSRSISNFKAQYPSHPLEVVGMVIVNTTPNPEEYTKAKQATIDFANDTTSLKTSVWPFLDQYEIKFSRSYQNSSRSGTPIFDTSYVRWDVARNFRGLARQIFKDMGM